MRVSSLLNQILAPTGAWVQAVTVTDDGLIVDISRRQRLHRCPCGESVFGRYDKSVRKWRDRDIGDTKVWLRAVVARVCCPVCERVRTEEVAWARPGGRHTRAFEDTVAWLAQRMDKTSVSTLMRCSWEAVNAIVERYVAENLDPRRMDQLTRIGVDEISYRRGRRYVTVVSDHDTRRVVWVGEGRRRDTLEEFYRELGETRCAALEAVTMDCGAAYIAATQAHAPNAVICFDAFHIVKWANEALDASFRQTRLPALRTKMLQDRSNRAWHKARFALRAARTKLGPEHRRWLSQIHRERGELYRAYLLKEELRDLFQIVPADTAHDYLTRWVTRAHNSEFAPFRNLADKIERHYDGIIAAVELDLSNSRAEGINTKIRVIQRRGYGMTKLPALTAMIYLCCSGISAKLPTQA